jgi:sugar phosphate isomerase/epimerase
LFSNKEDLMKLGFVSAILPDLALEDVLKFAKETGYTCVEPMCWPKGKAERRYAGVTHVDVTGMTKDQAAKIRDTVKASGVEVSGLGYYPNPLAPDAAEASVYVEHLKEVIKAAKLLGVAVVNTFIGRDWTKTVDDNWPRFKQVWPPLVKFAEDNAIKIAIENCPMYFSKDDTIRAAREFASRIFHAHAKDCRVDQNRLDEVGILATPLEFHTPKLPGLGEVDWGRLISVLGDAGYNGPLCVEVEDRTYEGCIENRKAALRQSARYLRQFVAE